MEFRNGSLDDSTRTIEILGRLAASLEREPMGITLLLGVSVERLQLSAVQEITQSPAATPGFLNRLRASLSQVDLAEQYRRAMILNGSSIVDVIRGGTIDEAQFREADYREAFPWVIRQWPDLAAAQFLDLQRKRSRLWGLPYPVAKASEDSEASKPFPLRQLDDVFLRDRPEFTGRISSMVSNRRLATIGVDLRIRRLESGHYPPNLAAVPDALKPDPFTGKPLRFERRADGSAELSSPEAPALIRDFTLEPQVSLYTEGCRWVLPR